MKRIRLILSPEAETVYNYLNGCAEKSKAERAILLAINKKCGLIKANPHYGNPVSHKLIPGEYKTKYGVKNLFRVELPDFWRMLYTLTDGETEIEIVAFVLDFISHPDYDKKFKYKKR